MAQVTPGSASPGPSHDGTLDTEPAGNGQDDSHDTGHQQKEGQAVAAHPQQDERLEDREVVDVDTVGDVVDLDDPRRIPVL